VPAAPKGEEKIDGGSKCTILDKVRKWELANIGLLLRKKTKNGRGKKRTSVEGSRIHREITYHRMGRGGKEQEEMSTLKKRQVPKRGHSLRLEKKKGGGKKAAEGDSRKDENSGKEPGTD